MGTDTSELTEALDRLETELHQLSGLLSVRKILGEASDGIDPPAVAALARASECSLLQPWTHGVLRTRPRIENLQGDGWRSLPNDAGLRAPSKQTSPCQGHAAEQPVLTTASRPLAKRACVSTGAVWSGPV